MSRVMFYQSALQFIRSSFHFLIALSLLGATHINLTATSSGNSRSSALSPPFASRKSYPLNAQKTRAKGSGAGTARWFTFKGPDGDFTLSFPGRPGPEQQVDQRTITIVRAFGLTTVGGNHYSINFNDIGGDPNARENNEWAKNTEELLAAADRKAGSRVVQIHRLEKNLIETELLESDPGTGAQINYLRRSILRRARVYTLACGSLINGKGLDKSVCQKFFASVRFTGTGLSRSGKRSNKRG
jgi:hypothetical protein